MISPKSFVPTSCTLKDSCIIQDNVTLGENCVIEEYCIIGYTSPGAEALPLKLADNVHIRSHSVIYAGSNIGANCIVGHRALIRERSTIGAYVQIGSGCEVEGDCTIGDFTKIHSNVQISKHTSIGEFVRIFPRVQFTNDPLPPSGIVDAVTIKAMAVIGTNALLLPGITVGLGAVVAAGSVVNRDVPDVYCVNGNPALAVAPINKIFNPKHGIKYPWAQRYRKGYPEECFARMDEILATMQDKLNSLPRRKQSL